MVKNQICLSLVIDIVGPLVIWRHGFEPRPCGLGMVTFVLAPLCLVSDSWFMSSRRSSGRLDISLVFDLIWLSYVMFWPRLVLADTSWSRVTLVSPIFI